VLPRGAAAAPPPPACPSAAPARTSTLYASWWSASRIIRGAPPRRAPHAFRGLGRGDAPARVRTRFARRGSCQDAAAGPACGMPSGSPRPQRRPRPAPERARGLLTRCPPVRSRGRGSGIVRNGGNLVRNARDAECSAGRRTTCKRARASASPSGARRPRSARASSALQRARISRSSGTGSGIGQAGKAAASHLRGGGGSCAPRRLALCSQAFVYGKFAATVGG
jgi:hypothetical protein